MFKKCIACHRNSIFSSTYDVNIAYIIFGLLLLSLLYTFVVCMVSRRHRKKCEQCTVVKYLYLKGLTSQQDIFSYMKQTLGDFASYSALTKWHFEHKRGRTSCNDLGE